jgi:hypothetical protein
MTIAIVYFSLYKILKALHRNHRLWFLAFVVFLSPFAFVLSQVRSLLELMWVLLLTPFYAIIVFLLVSTVWIVRFYCLAFSMLIITDFILQRKRKINAQENWDIRETVWARFIKERTNVAAKEERFFARIGQIFEGFSKYWSLVFCFILLFAFAITFVGYSSPVLRRPTYLQVQEFIQYDTTDNHCYVNGSYACSNFASDFRTNAARAGYECGLVVVLFVDLKSHELDCFNTTDKGVIFVEPQLDQIVNITIGQPYQALKGVGNCTVLGYYIKG